MKKLAALLLILAAFGGVAHAQAVVQLSPEPKYQFFDDNGDPLAGGKVCTYTTLTNTPLPTYTDYTGMTQNTNPVVLDIAGRANIWWDTTKTYRVVLRDAGTTSDCTTGTILWTVDGVAATGITSVGNLPPIFTTSVSGGSITFTLSNAAAHTVLGNCTGSAAPPTYCAPGSDTQVLVNESSQVVGDPHFTWTTSTSTLAVSDSGGIKVRLVAGAGGGEVIFGTSTSPTIQDVTDWTYVNRAGHDFKFGFGGSCDACMVLAGTGGTSGELYGTERLGAGSLVGTLVLNDGTSMAGAFAGPRIIAGSIATPETFISAATGSLFLTTNGGAMTTLWVKESSPTATTGWVAK